MAVIIPQPIRSEQQVPNDEQIYVMVEPQKPPQNALINASYTCSVLGVFAFGLILGPIGFILGLVAKMNDDNRGVKAMTMGAAVTVLSAIIFVWFVQSGI